LGNETSPLKTFYFSTRDLLIMAVLAALGGVSSTYINTIGDAVQAALGFPGATQWAAGLHTIWLVLAMGILRKTGTGTVTGITKGAVELMSGNTHGVIILLINLVAGMLVDFGILLFQNRRSIVAYLVAGGLSAASNVIVFQLFATLPTNILAISAIFVLMLIASISGVIFSGFVPFYLVNQLSKANVIKLPEKTTKNRKIGWTILVGVLFLAILLTVYLRSSLKGSPTIQITGAVENPYEFPDQSFTLQKVNRQMDYRGVLTSYTGYPLLDIVEHAQPSSVANTLLIEASDGYAFLISFDELRNNDNILIVQSGQGEKSSYDVVGPVSSKAWVRNVMEIGISVAQGLKIQSPSGELHSFNPDLWLADMDSIQVPLPSGSQKLQGVPLWKVVSDSIDVDEQNTIIAQSAQELLSLGWQEIKDDDNLRIFTVIEEDGYAFVLGTMSGEVLLYPLTEIEVQ
jgi:energy-coupling factor transport system substrate-specific component